MGYVTDVAYLQSFIAELAPEWLDLVALIGGVAPPARGDAYRWCELGCGRGLTTLILAAARPAATFVGIDLMPGHVAEAERTAERAGVANATFRAHDFAAAADDARAPFDRPFDYIVAHGVYAWIGEPARDALRRFVDRHLAPGGLVYLSYNSLPGWANDAPFQHLVHAFAQAEPGASDARFAAAAERVQALAGAGAPSLAASTALRRLREAGRGGLPLAYYAHEYLASDWRPHYVTEVRAAMAAIGLAPVGSATLADNFDRLVLRAAARDALAAIDDPELRALARDYCMNQRFRRDVFGRAPPPIDDAERRQRLLAMRVALARPAGLVDHALHTEAGEVRFDNPVARGIVAALAGGPRPAGQCRDAATGERDLVANLLTLLAAGALLPVPPGAFDPARLNAALVAAPDASDGQILRALPTGSAVRITPGTPTPPAGTPAAAWHAFLGLTG